MSDIEQINDSTIILPPLESPFHDNEFTNRVSKYFKY